MSDKFKKEVRSKIMSCIKSKGTSAEKLVHNYLKNKKIRHRMHPILPGNPDILLKDSNTIIFIDGCFWHMCPLHGHMPKTNIKYWRPKLKKNVKRDLENTKILKKMGFKVMRLWEHQVKLKNIALRLRKFKR